MNQSPQGCSRQVDGKETSLQPVGQLALLAPEKRFQVCAGKLLQTLCCQKHQPRHPPGPARQTGRQADETAAKARGLTVADGHAAVKHEQRAVPVVQALLPHVVLDAALQRVQIVEAAGGWGGRQGGVSRQQCPCQALTTAAGLTRPAARAPPPGERAAVQRK